MLLTGFEFGLGLIVAILVAKMVIGLLWLIALGAGHILGRVFDRVDRVGRVVLANEDIRFSFAALSITALLWAALSLMALRYR